MKKSLSIIFVMMNISISVFGQGFTQEGLASYYADNLMGSYTAYGESYDPNLKTAAHATLPVNTLVKVTNLVNNRSVVVKINDKLSESNRKVIMLSRAAATDIGLVVAGSLKVKVEEYLPDAAPIAKAVMSNSVSRSEGIVSESVRPSSFSEEARATNKIVSEKSVSTKPTEKFATPGTYNCEGELLNNVRGYTVQVAALSSLKAFTQLCIDLGKKDIGADIFVQVSENEKGKLYRILIGNYATFDVAKEKLAKVVTFGYQAVVRTHSAEASFTSAK